MSGKVKLTRKQYQELWEQFKDSIFKATEVDLTESYADQQKRIARLEGNDEEWFKYYFPNFSYAEPADFHKKGTKRVMNNPEWYEVRAWSRELAKSTRTMMEVLKLVLTKKKRNIIMVSSSYDNAVRLLAPYKASLEFNQRIIHDYGIQERLGSWEAGEFTTKSGTAFRAIGFGQNPRGTKNDEVRPDVLLIDDGDTDEECRNPDIVKKKWNWLEKALMGTRSISRPMLVIFCGNIIAKYCCITEAIKKADHVDIVNIRDKKGKSSWPQKNTEAMIDRVLSKISYTTAQQEYFNNPITEGTVFKEMAWKKARPLKDYSMLVCYTDPSFKESKKNDFKATVLVGKWNDEYHVIKAFVEQTTTAKMIEWHYQIMDFVGDKSCYYFMEQVFLQDLLLKEFYEAGKRLGRTIPISGDDRKKDDKLVRIETLLEPLNRNGKLYLNADEKDNVSMDRLKDQFLAIAPGNRSHDDGPDAVEGAVWMINKKFIAQSAGVTVVRRRPNPKGY